MVAGEGSCSSFHSLVDLEMESGDGWKLPGMVGSCLEWLEAAWNGWKLP
jgi:hypothetical protein